MSRIIYIFLVLFLLQSFAEAQVGINTSTPDSTSVLDVYSTSKGFLIPRMSSYQRNAMASSGNLPANSLMVFDTSLDKFFYYDNNMNKWVILNPWYSDDNNVISYGGTNSNYKIDFNPPGGSKAFRVFSSYSGVSSDSMKFQSEFLFDDYLISSSGIKFNAKVSGSNFILMKAYYKNQPVMTLKNSGNLGLGYTNPTKKLEVRGDAQASGEVSADKFVGKGTIPIGGIIIWKGSISSIPSGWALCDGNNGTPDLRNRFIIGGGGSYPQNSTGGAESVTLTTAQIPAHSHTGTTSSNGNHRHYVARNQEENSGSNSMAYDSQNGSSDQYVLQRHSSTANKWNSSSDGNHTHSLSVDNTGGGQPHENRPPYYALAYIIRIN